MRLPRSLLLCLTALCACSHPPHAGVDGGGPAPGAHSPGPSPVTSPSPALSACGDGACTGSEFYLNCPRDCPHRVGTFYSGWHWAACSALNSLASANQPVLTVEQLLQSRTEDGSATGNGNQFAQLLINNNMVGPAANFYYQHMPQGGQYCIVHQRQANDINYNAAHEGNTGNGMAPDCPGYAATIARQAQQMVAAGIDFVVMDGTNIADYNAGGDAIELRPLEVLVQEFTKLRATGMPTPEVAMWQRFPGNPVMANDSNDFLYRHVLNVYNDATNQNVLMHDAATGKLVYFYPDVGDFDPAFPAVINNNGGAHDIIAVPMWAYAQSPNQWSFMSSCQAGAFIDNGNCNQPWTPTSVLGSQMAVVPTYQTGWGSVAGQAAGVLGGLTLRKQFTKAIAIHPDYLLLSSWNETIAQPGSNGPSMGLETDPTANNVAFVDNYGTEFCRDIEPSEELGTQIYDLVASCLRIYRANVTTCNDPNEACCTGGNFNDNFVRTGGAGGSFVVYANAGNGRAALYGCTAGSTPFFSMDAACEGQTVVGTVGWLATRRGGTMLRSLFGCIGSSGSNRAYSLTASCPAGTHLDAVLGYVH